MEREREAHEERLGSAVLGEKVGDTVEYTTPKGDVQHVEILKSEPYTG